MKKCEMCNDNLDEPGSRKFDLTLETMGGTKTWEIGEVCQAAIEDFILEFAEDVEGSYQEERRRLKVKRNHQRTLQEEYL